MNYYDKHRIEAAGLEGKEVRGIHVSPGQSILLLDTDQGILGLEAEGDCCSESWWADIVNPKQLIGTVVKEVEALPSYQAEDARTRQEEDIVYGYKLHTPQGSCSLIFRNSSNGYYGGQCRFNWDWNYIPDEFESIDNDWSA